MKRKKEAVIALSVFILSVAAGVFVLAPVLTDVFGMGSKLSVTRVASFSFGGAGSGQSESAEAKTESTEDAASAETAIPTATATPTPTVKPTPAPTSTPTPVPTAVATSFEKDTPTSYFWPDSDRRYYSESDLVGLTAQQIATIRNEIYAREGYIFKTPSWLAYFTQKEWYKPRIKADDFTDAELNQYEYANVQMILAYETAHHLNGH